MCLCSYYQARASLTFSGLVEIIFEKYMYYPFFFIKEPALAPPAEWLALFFVPLGLPEGIWCCLGNI